jgi:pimeloyl-ACP methyl ester carboxylesterase
MIQMEGKPFKVRTIKTGNPENQTLVLMHGFGIASCMFGPLLGYLSQKYRVVLFDNLSFGLNSRLKESVALDSSESAEEWIKDMLVKTVNELDLPDKFFLAGWSHGGWQAAVLASQMPNRVQSLFLISPAGMETYNKDTYNPFDQLDSSQPWKRATQETVGFIENLHKNKPPIYGEELH